MLIDRGNYVTIDRGRNSQINKQHNRGLVLKLVATAQCRIRAELARQTGLTKMAVTNIVSELIDLDLLVESVIEPDEYLRKNSIALQISPKAPKIIGVLIFRDRFEAVLCDLSLNIIRRERINIEQLTRDLLIQTIFTLIDAVLSFEPDILGIGIASIGPIDKQAGIILEPRYFYNIKNVEIVDILKSRYGMPVFLDHDNQCGALAEMLYGYGKGFRDFILLGLSRGIGSGIVIDGKLQFNNQGLAPEIGHVSIDYQGLECVCGNRGCIEMYAASPVIRDCLRKATGLNLSFRDFCLFEDDERIDAVFIDVIQKLAVALISSVNLLNPELILLGHDSVCFPDKYVSLLEQEINRRKFTSPSHVVRVRKTYFKEDSQLLGAVCNVAIQAFDGKLLFGAVEESDLKSKMN